MDMDKEDIIIDNWLHDQMDEWYGCNDVETDEEVLGQYADQLTADGSELSEWKPL